MGKQPTFMNLQGKGRRRKKKKKKDKIIRKKGTVSQGARGLG